MSFFSLFLCYVAVPYSQIIVSLAHFEVSNLLQLILAKNGQKTVGFQLNFMCIVLQPEIISHLTEKIGLLTGCWY